MYAISKPGFDLAVGGTSVSEVKVLGVYGSRFGGLGSRSCSHRILHLNHAWGWVRTGPKQMHSKQL